MTTALRSWSLVLFLACVASLAGGQAATGAPPFSSLEGGPDVVNLGNLNVHMAYPVFHKAGRQLALSFDFTNDSSFWYPLTVNGTTSWNPVQTGGWSGSPQGVGVLLPSCVTDGQTFIVCGNFVYYDSAGTGHPFGGGTFGDGTARWYLCGVWNPCGDFPLNSITADGSGYTLNADACFVINGQCNLVISLTSADGNSIIPLNGIPLNPTATAGSVIDR